MKENNTITQAMKRKRKAAAKQNATLNLQLLGLSPRATAKTTTMAKRLAKQAKRPVKVNPPHFWTNCRVREDHHTHQCAAFILVHEATGRYFIDATASFYSHMQFQELSLKGNLHPNTEVQRLYNQSPRFELHYEIVGGDDRNGLNRLEAEELKQMWLAHYATDPQLINSKTEAIGYQAMGMARPLRMGNLTFANVKEAARELGKSERTVTLYCNDPKKPNWGWL